MVNGQRCSTLFLEKVSRFSTTTTLAPRKASSMAVRKPHGPPPIIKHWQRKEGGWHRVFVLLSQSFQLTLLVWLQIQLDLHYWERIQVIYSDQWKWIFFFHVAFSLFMKEDKLCLMQTQKNLVKRSNRRNSKKPNTPERLLAHVQPPFSVSQVLAVNSTTAV